MGFIYKNIFIITIIQIILIGILYYYKYNTPQYNYTNNNEGSSRNERSTPREFLLPATPAVSKIQESRNKKVNIAHITNCLSIINDAGFIIYNLTDNNAANSIASIYAYQKMNGLEKTGKLDEQTKINLECEISYD